MGFDKDDILRQAGYSEGDYIPLLALGGDSSNKTTTSTSYTTDENIGLHDPGLHEFDTFGVTLIIRAGNDTNGETTFVKLQSLNSGTDISGTEVTVEGDNTVSISSGIVEYTPDTIDRLRTQVKVTGGTASTNYDVHSQVAIIYGEL